MRPRFARLEIVTRQERNAAISLVREAAVSAGGWVVTFTLLSNLAATLVLTIPGAELAAFRAALAAADLRATGELPPNAGAEDEITITVQMTFIHNEPDLRRAVPAVPG